MKLSGNIFLVGPMGVGKSTIGRVIAEQLELEFFDSDREIEATTGADIPWIFDVEGESGFRQREQRILDAALELLLEYGEETVTVEQIAHHVDIGKGTIYKHFTSKVEIYMRLLFNYEAQLEDSLKQAIREAEQGNYAAPARAYFESRMSDPTKDRLFQRLEEKIIALKQAQEMIEKLHGMRDEINE